MIVEYIIYIMKKITSTFYWTIRHASIVLM